MNPLLEQFLSESREFSQGIGEKLMQMEDAPSDQGLINELFRLVHTLKGNSGLFTFPEMTRVLHAGEDLLGMVRSGRVAYSRELADRLLDAIDFVMELCADIEATERIDCSRAQDSARVAHSLRALIPIVETEAPAPAAIDAANTPELGLLAEVPEATRIEALNLCRGGEDLHWIRFVPAHDCFFQGDDPFFCARQTPGLLWGGARPSEPLKSLAELDTYRCVIEFHLLTSASREELNEHFRYVPDQVRIAVVNRRCLEVSEFKTNGTRSADKPVPSATLDEASQEQIAAVHAILAAQQQILMNDDRPDSRAGRLHATGTVLRNLAKCAGDQVALSEIDAALTECVTSGKNSLLLMWLEAGKQHLIDRLLAPPDTCLPGRPMSEDPTWDGRLDHTFKTMLDTHLSRYRMASQTVTHLAVSGGATSIGLDRPMIELF